jgi:hypothetical protein
VGSGGVHRFPQREGLDRLTRVLRRVFDLAFAPSVREACRREPGPGLELRRACGQIARLLARLDEALKDALDLIASKAARVRSRSTDVKTSAGRWALPPRMAVFVLPRRTR